MTSLLWTIIISIIIIVVLSSEPLFEKDVIGRNKTNVHI